MRSSFDGEHIQLRTSGSVRRLRADTCVVALMPDKLLEVLPDSRRGNSPSSQRPRMMQTAPIVGVHVWYDRPIMNDMFVAAIDTPVQWVFNVTGMRETEDDDGGQHIVISLSGAWKWKGHA